MASVSKVKSNPKTQQKTVNSPKPSSTGFFEFFGGVKEEIKKVSWTSKEELKLNTKVVLGSTLFFGMLIYLMDFSIYSLLNLFSNLSKFLGA